MAPPFFFLSVCALLEQFVETLDLLFLPMVAVRQQADGDTRHQRADAYCNVSILFVAVDLIQNVRELRGRHIEVHPFFEVVTLVFRIGFPGSDSADHLLDILGGGVHVLQNIPCCIGGVLDQNLVDWDSAWVERHNIQLPFLKILMIDVWKFLSFY